MKSRLRLAFLIGMGKLFNLAGIPPMVCEVETIGIGGVPVKVKVSDLYTIISVGGYDLFFRRLTGRWDGTGSGNPDVIAHATWNSDGREVSDDPR